MTDPSRSTGAQPSAEAIEAAILSTREDLERLKAWARYALVDGEAFVAGVNAALERAPAIHAAGVAEGRAEARREFENRCTCRHTCGDTPEDEGGVCKWPEQWPANRATWQAQIAAEGRAAGRDEALREVVAWLRDDGDAEYDAVADAIEAAFPLRGSGSLPDAGEETRRASPGS